MHLFCKTILTALLFIGAVLCDTLPVMKYQRNLAITGATNATPIVITATGHNLQTGHRVTITGVAGNTAANGSWIVTRVNADTFSLMTSVGNGAYTSGGVVTASNLKTLQAAATVSGATNAAPIVITTSASHGLETGDIVQLSSVGGNTAANGQWVINVASATTFSLLNSAGNAAYTSGGSVAHIGFSANVLTDNTVFATAPSLLNFGVHVASVSSGANVRVVVEDSADSSFVTAQPLAMWQAYGPVTAAEPRSFSVSKHDLPDVRIAASGNYIRAKVFLSGGAAKTASVLAFLHY